MTDALNINISQKKTPIKFLGFSLPCFYSVVTKSNYTFSSGEFGGSEDGSSPLESLVTMLSIFEIERNMYRPIGPIQASFELLDDERAYGWRMELLLRMYARSENTTVTFNHK